MQKVVCSVIISLNFGVAELTDVQDTAKRS